MTHRNLVLMLRPPGEIGWAQGTSAGRVATPYGDLIPLLSDWSTLPDLLIGAKDRELLGLTFYFADAYDEKLRMVKREWDSRRYRVVESGGSDWEVRYPCGFSDGAYLEVVIRTDGGGVQQVAQLDFSEFSWLFLEGDEHPVGLGIWDIHDLLEEYDVMLSRNTFEEFSAR